MGKKKKPFIDKKRSVRFHLVHRDQRDPLQADPEASERVLLPVEKQEDDQREEQKKHGIFFNDEYDYMQHLKPRGDGILLMADESGSQKEATSKDIGGITFPKEAFASEYEEAEGMLEKGVLPRGPQPDWDPDIVEALDDGLDLDDPGNMLEDDFMMLANMEASSSWQNRRDIDDESDDSYSDRDFDSDEFDFGSSDNFANEETKSRFTSYSMTSSVIRRTEGLQLLDDQFEKVMEEYDDEEIGGLDEDGADEMVADGEKLLMDQVITDLDEKESKKSLENSQFSHVIIDEEDNGNSNEEEFERLKEPMKEKWDCESIISTYSNIYNHPKLIAEPKPIKLTKNLGIPSGILKKKKQEGNVEVEIPNEENCTMNYVRQKNESKEDKKLRKNAVKEERRNRRVEKKANKAAFKDEHKIQERILASQPLATTVPI